MNDLFGWAALVVAIGGVIKIWYDVRSVHTIVNSQKTAMQKEIDDLRNLIKSSISKDEPVTVAGEKSVPKALKRDEMPNPPLSD
jgi:hypothetical protein